MRRIVVVGGLGFFGRATVERLRADGVKPLVASRRAGADIQVDAEDQASLRAALRPADVVIDTVGPFQNRTTALVESATGIGFDLIDISDSLDYAMRVYALRSGIEAAGIRVLTSCSCVSAVSATAVRLSGIEQPLRVTGCLAPAARHTANPGAAGSLLLSVGRPIRVLRDGRLVTRYGWRESRTFPTPLGRIRGYLFETADSVTLPGIWPTLRTVDFYVRSNVPALDAVFRAAAWVSVIRRFVERHQSRGFGLARRLGSPKGCLAYEIEGPQERVVRFALVGSQQDYITPVAPAVMAAHAIAEGRFEARGLIPPDRHVQPMDLMNYLRPLGIEFAQC